METQWFSLQFPYVPDHLDSQSQSSSSAADRLVQEVREEVGLTSSACLMTFPVTSRKCPHLCHEQMISSCCQQQAVFLNGSYVLDWTVFAASLLKSPLNLSFSARLWWAGVWLLWRKTPTLCPRPRRRWRRPCARPRTTWRAWPRASSANAAPSRRQKRSVPFPSLLLRLLTRPRRHPPRQIQPWGERDAQYP